MAAIYQQTPLEVPKPKWNRRENKPLTGQKGIILILTFLTLGILLLLGTYFLSFTLAESRIAKSQEIGTKTYYLAEAGINEAIWKLKYDNTWATKFITKPGCATWQATFTRELFPGGSYTISIKNSECARGEITSISTIALPKGKFSQRIVKITVNKALGSPIKDSALFSGGTSENIIIDNSQVRINRGNLFSNNNMNIRHESDVRVFDNPDTIDILEGQILVVRNLLIDKDSTVTSTTRCAKNVCTVNCEKCPADRIKMPAIDFDSAKNPNSLKNRAKTSQDGGGCQVLCNGVLCSLKCIFTESEFRDLLWQVGFNGTLTLNNKITYVGGEVELKGGRNLVVNGILAADGDIELGRDDRWRKDRGPSRITVNEPAPGKASGLLSKKRIYFGKYLGLSGQIISLIGLIYSLADTKLDEVPAKLEVSGGIVANALQIDDLLDWLEITVDNERIGRVFYLTQPPEGGAPVIYSPVITIEHWREVY